ncbi:MAG: hypothetical protein ABI051_11385 [Vicinamibacterales bacterium]
MSNDSRKALDPLVAAAAPHRRRFLKQILAGSTALAFLGLPESTLLAQDRSGGEGKGKGKAAKGKAKGKGKGEGEGDGGRGGRGKGKGEGGRGKGTGRG